MINNIQCNTGTEYLKHTGHNLIIIYTQTVKSCVIINLSKMNSRLFIDTDDTNLTCMPYIIYGVYYVVYPQYALSTVKKTRWNSTIFMINITACKQATSAQRCIFQNMVWLYVAHHVILYTISLAPSLCSLVTLAYR